MKFSFFITLQSAWMRAALGLITAITWPSFWRVINCELLFKCMPYAEPVWAPGLRQSLSCSVELSEIRNRPFCYRLSILRRVFLNGSERIFTPPNSSHYGGVCGHMIRSEGVISLSLPAYHLAIAPLPKVYLWFSAINLFIWLTDLGIEVGGEV